ncbi:MAG: carbamoyl-phosphate synthase small subunit, partial [Methyloversatilis sp. 12-65-5]
MSAQAPALLALADGSVFHGKSIGAETVTTGEVVFNTAMTGYQEILTDPSYTRQIVTLTYPHIGNTGINHEDVEAGRVFAAGLVIRDLPLRSSNFRSHQTLDACLREQGIPGIANIDTRKLTRVLREKGAQSGCLMAGKVDVAEALAQARAFAGLSGMDLAKVVSATEPYDWTEGEWQLGLGFVTPAATPRHVVAYDFGVKQNILRQLVDVGCAVTVVPASTTAKQVHALKPDGVFLSNGPGDPEGVPYAIEAVRELIGQYPLFGICLGHQILGLALGLKTYKLKFGHHGANHPVMNLRTRQVEITSQNHNFAVQVTQPISAIPDRPPIIETSFGKV